MFHFDFLVETVTIKVKFIKHRLYTLRFKLLFYKFFKASMPDFIF